MSEITVSKKTHNTNPDGSSVPSWDILVLWRRDSQYRPVLLSNFIPMYFSNGIGARACSYFGLSPKWMS